MLLLGGQFERSFLDRYRLLRAVLIGFLVSFPLAWVLSPKEAISLGMLVSLGLDAWLICRESWRMNADQTRAFFTQFQERSAYLIERTVALNFIGFGVISLCLSDLGARVSVLPHDLRVVIYFFSVLLIWLALHHGFAFHYAGMHFSKMSDACSNETGAIFRFPGESEPVFFDFLYVAYTVGMTFEMSDVGAKTTEVRKVVIVQSLLAFLYTTIAISAFVSLFKL